MPQQRPILHSTDIQQGGYGVGLCIPSSSLAFILRLIFQPLRVDNCILYGEHPATSGCATAAETKPRDGTNHSECMVRALYERLSSLLEEKEELPPTPVRMLSWAMREKDFFLDAEAVLV
ncbi:hypothetical protein VE03_08273 [Pseudogymnoascus sp. 23342-1-I1]|nr:hypothetical protein VE03_08273 [Pseudogymnoascus sp. 23342-1-I1]